MVRGDNFDNLCACLPKEYGPHGGDLLWHAVPSDGFLNGHGSPLHEKKLAISNYRLKIDR